MLVALTDLDRGRRLGRALICAGARYASIQGAGAARLERRHATVTTWRELEAEVALGLPPGPLPGKSVLSRVLPDRSDIVMQHVTFEDLPPSAQALDRKAHVLGHLLALIPRQGAPQVRGQAGHLTREPGAPDIVDSIYFESDPDTAVPEPASLLLLGSGLFGLAARTLRARRK